MGNLAIVEAIHTFSPSKQTAFSSYLWLVLQRRMRSVVEHEWQGFVQRTYTGSNANHRRTSQTYVPPEFVEISDTLSTASTQEHLSAIAEVVRFLDTNVTAANRAFFLERLDGATPTELQQKYGPHHSSIVHRIRGVCQRLTAWSKEVSYG